MSTLGQRLQAAVINLWGNVHRLWDIVNRHEKILKHHGQKIAEMDDKIKKIKKEKLGLSISAGMQKANKEKAQAELNELRKNTKLN